MGKIENKIMLGILALSSILSLSTTMYVKNNSELKLDYSYSENDGMFKFGYEPINTLNAGAFLGKSNEAFLYLGGKIKKEHIIDGIANLGVFFKKKINEHIELTLNTGYQYEGGMEDSIKEGLKLKGLWDKKYEEDETLRKEFYHSQGLRLKGNPILASGGVLDLTYGNTKSKIGAIYTIESFSELSRILQALPSSNIKQIKLYNSLIGRIETFVNVNQKLNNLGIDLNLNYKLKPDISKRLGRLKGDVTLTRKIGDIELSGKVHAYLGTILISDKKREFGGEIRLGYNKDRINIKSTLKHSTLLDYSANKGTKDDNKEEPPKSDSTDKLLHKQELTFDLGYKNNKIEFNTENKLRGKVFTDKLKIDKDKYKSDSLNKDFTVFSIYTSNSLKTKIGNVGIKADIKYRLGLDIDKDTSETYKHLALVGVGAEYNNKTKKIETSNSVNTTLLIGYNKYEIFAINAWSDNKADYIVNDKTKLFGELNLTSSNRLSFYSGIKAEILGFVDLRGNIEYKIKNNLEFINELGAKAILLFSKKDENDKNTNNINILYIPLTTQYQYKVYNDSSILYKVKDNIRIKSKLGLSYLNGYDSETLYSALRDIKRKQIDSNGIVEISRKDRFKISSEKHDYGVSLLSKIVINPSIEGELKFLGERLTVKPNGEVKFIFANKADNNVNSVRSSSNNTDNKKFKYNSTVFRVGLGLDYKW
ncbi:Uncharacterised protein [Streptobacillus moniliformis]|uniref:Uncharacterized protein n=1 Tax=Streptobacillus moniliformis (strain ATCC 14647 / DSM 12112 / NCTC 10651 / 9901) TaxID=519441 RepID=D1AWT8_STRM9|nr:hypothetical protein [Streptobacillus moniliformis]ACZ00764.1 hypothetical protein Smon_0280 [Streptobacillus moniliformis DSM 12112]SQA14106.1 Uncharacterised protein [Streptobacillus moniliformis]